jgi:predicted Rossmann fold nucleotide-binding protein DprA/Smf involved in DNA uptake
MSARRLKTRLREDAPAVLYGCGDINLLETGGLAVVGSRYVDEKLISEGLNALHKKGAIPWPNPKDVDAFNAVFDVIMPDDPVLTQPEIGLFSNNETPTPVPSTTPVRPDDHSLLEAAMESLPPDSTVPKNQMVVDTASEIPRVATSEFRPADILFATVREAMQRLLTTPMKEDEVAAALEVSNAQTKAWLQRLVVEGVLEKLGKPVRYVVRLQALLLSNGVFRPKGLV